MPFFNQFPKTVYDFQNSGIDTQITDIFRFAQTDLQIADNVSLYEYYQIRDGDRPDVVSSMLYGTPDYYWTFFLCNEHLKNGLVSWPMSGAQFEQYISNEYEGTAIITRPSIVRDGDGIITEYRDSLAGRFSIGETITGSISQATGTLFKKDAQLSQMIVRQVNGTFIGNHTYPLTISELVTGSETNDQVSSWTVCPWADAPHHYVKADGTITYNSLYIDEQYIPNGTDNPADVTDPVLTPVSNREYEASLNDENARIRVVRPSLIYSWAQTYRDLISNNAS